MTQSFTLALAQINPTVGNLAANAARMVEYAARAADLGADLVLFPEMCLTGYPPEDLMLIPAFRAQAMEAAEQFARDVAHLPCDVIFGSVWCVGEDFGQELPSPYPSSAGGRGKLLRSEAEQDSRVREHGEAVYNASLMASGGQLSLLRAKHNLPNYGVFDERRVFDAGALPQVVQWRGIRLGVLICEEVWDVAAAERLAAQGAELLLVQNASPYHLGKASQRKTVVQAAVAAIQAPLVYLNLVGGQDELVFDGRSYVVAADGSELARMAPFREDLAVLKWEKVPPLLGGGRGSLCAESDAGFSSKSVPLPTSPLQGEGLPVPPPLRDRFVWHCANAPMASIRSDEETIYHALVLGLRDYVHKNGFPGVVIGLSGGIDSGLSAAIAADALGAQAVHAVRMPSPYSSVDSMEDAEQLAAALGLRMDTLSIVPLMEAADATLAPLFAGRPVDLTEENIQARLRGLLLMGLSNKFGPMVLTTGNKSEMSVGYATLYGDMCGGFSVLKDVYKTTVFALSRWRNTLGVSDVSVLGFQGAAGQVIPERMITKPPTAELRPNQKDEDSLPPYPVLDSILRGLIERQLSVAELVAEGHDDATVTRVARMVAAAEYKRRQSAPGVKITPMAFGRDRRWPITNRWRFGG